MKEALLLCIAYILMSSSFSQDEGFPPSFTEYPSAPTVDEGNYTGNPKWIFNLTASVRNPNLNVTISVDGSSSDIVYVTYEQSHNEAYGQVYVKTQLDRERASTEQLIFTARSSQSTAPLATLSITLYINDINDESPNFSPPAYQVTLPENYSVNTRVQDLKILATDPDMGRGGEVKYRIEPTGQAEELYKGYFTIHTESEGAYLKLIKELDYETLTFLQYKIIATDGIDPFHNSTAELLVKVQDVQDKPPTFQGLPYIKNVPENVKGAIFNVKALDGDLGIPRSVNYGLINDSCASYLSINETSGEIRVKETLDRDSGEIHEVRGVCSIKVEAFEVGTNKTNETQSTTDFTLTIDDINDNPPTFKNQTYEGSVAENTTGITITFTQNIHVEDIDQNGHNAITLTVLYSNLTVHDRVEASPAEIIGKGIVLLRVIKAFDFEKEESVDLVLRAEDTGNQSLNSTCNVTVKIIDSNDNDPIFINETYNVDVPENSCQNTLVGQIQATDIDSGDFGNISYRINGADNGFGIDSKSGWIYVASNKSCNCLNICCEESILDREKIQTYYMTMEAQDGGGRRTPVSVVIHLLDENDNAPVFLDRTYEFSIKENSSVFSSGKDTAVLTASDEDQKDTNNSRVSYCILDEDDNCTSDKHFTIDNNGTIAIIKELDFENLTASSSSKYREVILKVMAYDHGNKTMNSTVNVTIIVQDENDNGPKFNGNYEGHVKENSPPGTSILRVSADDDDGTAPNNEVSYFIFLGGSDQFKMDGNSGNLSVQIGAKLDRESVSSYNLTIIAIDKGNPQRTGTTNVTLEIDDVNDTPPELLNLPDKIQIKENRTDNEIIFICNGSDKDMDSVLSYSIQIKRAYDLHDLEFNVSKDYFMINKTTGEIHVRDFVDAEKESSFLLNIAVTDEKTHGNAINTTKAVLTVDITDINDNPPVFTDKSLSAGLLRSSPYNTVVMDLKDFVSDQDSTAKHRIHKFYLSSITKHGLDEIPNDIITSCKKAFCVTENGTVVSNILFTGKGRMELNIEVNDTAGSSQTTLDIYIIDESQQLSMHFQRSKNDVNKVKEDVLSTLSDKIGYKCVFDQINPYQDKDGNIIEYQSSLTFHVINEKRKIVLDAIFVEGVLDKHGDDLKELRNRHGVAAIGALQITDVGDEGSKIKETYILVAAIVLLTLILGIVIYFYISTSSKFKRRLKAATISSTEKKNSQSLGNAVIPGSNMFSKNKNPLIDKDEEVQRTIGNQDCASLAGSEDSLDCNEVEYEKRESYLGKDPIEEKEAVLEMYGEDGGFPIINDDDMALLKQALQRHDKLTSENENGGSKDGDLDVIQGKVNEGYEIVEATDV